MITADTITQTVHKLGQLFLRSYQSGQQSRDLQAENATAFGQFLDQLSSHHRGLHGTAASLRVLGVTGTSIWRQNGKKRQRSLGRE